MARSQDVVEASVTVASRGVARWSIEAVSREAGCAKGLVLYHFRSKSNLLAQTAEAIATDLHEARIAGLASQDPIDGLWQAVRGGVASGRFGAFVALAAGSRIQARSGLRAAAARALTVPVEALARETALVAALDGLALQLLMGTSEADARRAYDELWVNMVSSS